VTSVVPADAARETTAIPQTKNRTRWSLTGSGAWWKDRCCHIPPRPGCAL